MIHHVSIPARDPRHVAEVLGELLQGYVGPFVAPFPGSWVAYEDDGNGSGFEVYPAGTAIVPGEGDAMGAYKMQEPDRATAFHALVSVKVDRATIERIGAREGWRTLHFWRGPSPEVRLFELYEFWVENRVLLELVTPDMVPAYARITSAAAQRELLARIPRR